MSGEASAVRDRPLLLALDAYALEITYGLQGREHDGIRIGLDLGERMRLLDAEGRDPQAAQPDEVRAATQRRAEIGSKRANVRAARTGDAQRRFGIVAAREVLDLQLVDADITRLPLDLFAGARELVEPSTVHLECRHHRRNLFDGAPERFGGTFELDARERHLGSLEHRA